MANQEKEGKGDLWISGALGGGFGVETDKGKRPGICIGDEHWVSGYFDARKEKRSNKSTHDYQKQYRVQ